MCIGIVSVRGLVEWTVSWVSVTLRFCLVSSSFVSLVSTPFYSTSGFLCARMWVGGMEHMFYHYCYVYVVCLC